MSLPGLVRFGKARLKLVQGVRLQASWPSSCWASILTRRNPSEAGWSSEKSGGRKLAYTTCVIATGAEPIRLAVDGVDDPSCVGIEVAPRPEP